MEGEKEVSEPTTPKTRKTDSVPTILKSVLDTLPTDVSPDQRKQVQDLLEEYVDIFSSGTYDMGRTNLIEHTIDTGSNRPIRQALRRHPRTQLDEIDNQVNGLLENELIEPAASPGLQMSYW